MIWDVILDAPDDGRARSAALLAHECGGSHLASYLSNFRSTSVLSWSLGGELSKFGVLDASGTDPLSCPACAAFDCPGN